MPSTNVDQYRSRLQIVAIRENKTQGLCEMLSKLINHRFDLNMFIQWNEQDRPVADQGVRALEPPFETKLFHFLG